MALWIKLCPSKIYAQVLTLVPVDVTLLGEQGLGRYSTVEIRSYCIMVGPGLGMSSGGEETNLGTGTHRSNKVT
jgi:hypothetical protein